MKEKREIREREGNQNNHVVYIVDNLLDLSLQPSQQKHKT